MNGPVFITGGSGFVGGRLVDALLARGVPLVLLDRSGALAERLSGRDRGAVSIIRGSLEETESYADALSRTRAVLHLAAATGRAPAAEHHRTNALGTASLVAQCRRAGVDRLLFVSSIAARFPDQRGYPYAQAKLAAEESVRASGLRFTILRPTIILGQGSPILSALGRLAGLPVLPIFGDGRTLVQPIHVDDVVDFIVAILEQDRFAGETLELGGDTVLPIEDLIQDIRHARTGARGRVVHVPLRPVFTLLRVAELVGLGRLLPVTAGQLSSFRYSGAAERSAANDGHGARLRGLADMLMPTRAA